MVAQVNPCAPPPDAVKLGWEHAADLGGFACLTWNAPLSTGIQCHLNWKSPLKMALYMAVSQVTYWLDDAKRALQAKRT